MNHKDFFNSLAEEWDSICSHDTDKINKILDMLSVKEGSRILDVGTGTGVLIPFLHSRIGKSGRIVAVDISDKMLEVARKKFNYDNVEYVLGDILNIELPDFYFDYIICYSVFPHFENKQLALLRMSRYVKRGGKIIVCHSQSRDDINNLHKGMTDTVSKDRLPNASTIKEYFSKAGMKTIDEVDNDEMFVVIAQK